MHLGGHAQHRLARADRVRRRAEAVDHQMRHVGEQHEVLGAHRLRLDPVGHDDLRSAAARDGGELAGGREAGAAAPRQAGALGGGDQRLGSRRRQRAVDGGVLGERERAASPDTALKKKKKKGYYMY